MYKFGMLDGKNFGIIAFNIKESSFKNENEDLNKQIQNLFRTVRYENGCKFVLFVSNNIVNSEVTTITNKIDVRIKQYFMKYDNNSFDINEVFEEVLYNKNLPVSTFGELHKMNKFFDITRLVFIGDVRFLNYLNLGETYKETSFPELMLK